MIDREKVEHTDDEKIIELYWQRNENAIAATSEKYGNYCVSIANNILTLKEDAEECVNDTWLHAWNAIPPHRPPRLAYFLGKITRELAINRYKARFAQKRGEGEYALALDELADFLTTPSDTVEQAFELKLIGKAISNFLRKQPNQYADIFIRRYYHLCSIKQITNEFAISESKAKSILFRLRKKLYAYLESEGLL